MSREMYDIGARIKQEVLGKQEAGTGVPHSSGTFMADFNKLVTEYCWGEIWNREGLSRQTRSLLNVAMLTAMGRASGLRVHIKGGLNNGCTAADFREVLLQVAVYCGVPAALEGFQVTRQVLEEQGINLEAIDRHGPQPSCDSG